jgi:hypothetical protein
MPFAAFTGYDGIDTVDSLASTGGHRNMPLPKGVLTAMHPLFRHMKRAT